MTASLLVELFCEELPPKALERLGQAFAQGVRNGLAARGFLDSPSETVAFATPRRLAVRTTFVLDRSPDAPKRDKVLPVSIAFGADGRPQAPLLKKLASLGLTEADIPKLVRANDGKAEALFHDYVAPGVTLDAVLGDIVSEAIAKLPIPKVMSYQLPDMSTVQFVRPAHRLIALHGERVVPIEVLGLRSDRVTLGHRFLSQGEIAITNADSYEYELDTLGKVVASFDARRIRMREGLSALAGNDVVQMPDTLVDEVAALVEWPVVYEGRFESEFLEVPQECLILTMQLNQKYFAIKDRAGALRNRFLLVSNLSADDSSRIVGGNERVLRARLADAKFFYDTDRKQRLESRLDALAHVTYHNKLGSVRERVSRIERIAEWIATRLGADVALARRAALLAKCDLTTGMVGEFPELQGVMGEYYARHDGEHSSVARAIGMQYRPRFDDATLARDGVVASSYLAERAETLVGIWGIGLAPTGEKDPYALRRAALGLIDIFESLGAEAAALDLRELLEAAHETFSQGAIANGTIDALLDFIYDRARHQLVTKYDRDTVEAVIALRPPLHELATRIQAVGAFRALPESASLAAANKRIGNILKKADARSVALNAGLFSEPAERALAEALDKVLPDIVARYMNHDYASALTVLAALRTPVDAFFDSVMVMADDEHVRANRLALLRELHIAMNRVADLSRLAA
ncbi:MAG TPA: glycine--tRNA ligase subunit beta [Burkholderiaceae bacterium]|nr:glycine--tRNA ligase subunit beta [Burkholderiaceae bacterium]